MDTFYILTFLNDNSEMCRSRFDSEDEAMAAWYNEPRRLFLDEVRRIEDNFR